MQVNNKEIEYIKKIGTLFGSEIKLVKTLGGFYFVVGKKDPSDTKKDFILGGSHPAIVVHKLEKMFGNHFKPALAKSEQAENFGGVTEDYTEHCLEKSYVEEGYEIFVLKKHDNPNLYQFYLLKYGMPVVVLDGEVNKEEKTLYIKKSEDSLLKNNKLEEAEKELNKDLYTSLSLSIVNKANALGLEYLSYVSE